MKQKKNPKNNIKKVFVIIFVCLLVVYIAISFGFNQYEKNKANDLTLGNVKSDDYEKNSLDIFERPEYSFAYSVKFKVEEGPDRWDFNSPDETMILREIPNGKYDDKTIFSLVPQFVEPATDIEKTVVNGYEVTTADYWMVNTKQNFKLGDEGDGYLPAYGCIVNLPKTKLFIFISGKTVFRDELLNIVSSLKVKNYNQDIIDELKKIIYGGSERSVKLYTSNKLGVKIYSIFGEIVEVGNKLYGDGEFDKQGKIYGQFIQVFKKDPKMTTKQAVESLILRGYSKDKCLIVENGDTIEIKDITRENIDDPYVCPSEYSQTNGKRYFTQESKFSDRLLFVSYGQYGPMWRYELF